MKYFDVFAGVGGFCLGMPRHYKCVGVSETDKFCNYVLELNFPDVYNFGDITQIDIGTLPDFDLLVGGSPCQGMSTAGERYGLEDHRSCLFFHYIRILKEKQPKYFLWENVENALSVNDGEDFEII